MIERKEIDFYRKVLPAWKKLIQDRKANFEIMCFDSPYTEFNEEMAEGSILVMQNLKTLGFHDSFDKLSGLDITHAKLALSELAKFHALGYAHLQTYPGGVQEGLKDNDIFFTDYYFVKQAPEIKEVLETIFESIQLSYESLLVSVAEPGQDFLGAFSKWNRKNNVFDARKMLYSKDMKGFKTACHGDPHINNLLFK